MSEWVSSLPGTETGAQLALVCALISAIFHALFGSLQKAGGDPWLNRGTYDAAIFVLSAPVALFLVPWPTPELFLILLGAMVIHFFYKLTITFAYVRAPYTVVYPVVRGSSPVITIIFASIVFDEQYTLTQWAGVACLSMGILALSAFNIAKTNLDIKGIYIALGWALICGVTVAAYTIWDAYGIRLAAHPFTFLAWFFMLTALDFPLISYRRWCSMPNRPPIQTLVLRGLIGAVVAFISFGGVMLATYFDKVGEAAVLRETSTVFAALIGWLVLKETVGPKRTALMVLIALGAIIVEFG